MPFSSVPWVPVDTAATPKRARSDSAVEFSILNSKRTKRTLSHGDENGAKISPSSLSKQQQSESFLSLNTNCRPDSPFHNCEYPQDTIMVDVQPNHTLHNFNTGRHSSASLSISSGATIAVSDPPVEYKTDGLKYLFRGDHVMTNCVTKDSHQSISPITTFHKFFDLKFELQIKVLAFAEVCPVGQRFKPFYKQGMCKSYIVNKKLGTMSSDVDATEWEIENTYVMSDNVDFLTPAFVNKKYATRYIEAFYSYNIFIFNNPRATMWFFKSLGSKFQHLRQVELSIKGGLGGKYDVYSEDLPETLEELWFGVVCWIEHKHRFENLLVSFMKSPGEHELRLKLADDKLYEMLEFREKVAQRFSRQWNIKRVRLEDSTCSFFRDKEELLETELGMLQLGFHHHEDKRKTPLRQVFEKIRDERILRELMAEEAMDAEFAATTGITIEEARESRLALASYNQSSAGRDHSHYPHSWMSHGTEQTSNYLSSSQRRRSKRKENKYRRKREAPVAEDSLAGQLSAYLEAPDRQKPQSRIPSTYNSGRGDTASILTTHRTSSSARDEFQVSNNRSPRTDSSWRSNDIRNEYDRSGNWTWGNRRTGARGSGRHPKNYYGNKRYSSSYLGP